MEVSGGVAATVPVPSSAKTRLRRWLLPIYKPSRTRLAPSIWRSILLRPAVFEIWFRVRGWWFLATRGLSSLQPQTATTFVDKVRSYNQSQIWEFYRMRTEKLMRVLRCIDHVPADAKILCIGPRNEAEILLLSLYGFPLRNITGVDLFSYSPHIRCMDMHDLKFPSHSFDVVYSAWTLKYSYDLPRACNELLRVVRPGGLIVTGFSHTATVTDEVGAPIRGGLQELLGHFAPQVELVNWQESTPVGDAEDISVIFRVKATRPPQEIMK